MATKPPIIAIVGPTASGKTELAIELAERWHGEIICADSRTVYKEMNIGTAKPSVEDQARVAHWGIDLVYPDDRFNAADFKRYATNKISEIHERGHTPFIVGGTGLYVDALLYDYQFGNPVNQASRQALEAMSIEELYDYCSKNNIPLPQNFKNKRYVIRTIERKNTSGIGKSVLPQHVHIVGIATDTTILKQRIATRAEHIFTNDVATEATILGNKYGWSHESMTGNIYPLLRSYLEDDISLQDAVGQFTTLDYRLAKRQMTWFRRNPDIMWASLTEASMYVDTLLATE